MTSWRHNAFSLVEVTLALGVAAFCIVALFGLLPIGLNSNRDAINQTVAASLATSVAADLRADPTGTLRADTTYMASPRFGFRRTLAATGTVQSVFINEDGSIAASATAAPYRITVFLTAPAVAAYRSASTARILVTWPASVDATATTAPTKFRGSFETVIALDRN